MIELIQSFSDFLCACSTLFVLFVYRARIDYKFNRRVSSWLLCALYKVQRRIDEEKEKGLKK